jgi:hypothetical protein
MDISCLCERQVRGFFNIHETARLLNINYQTVRQNIQRGSIPAPSQLIGRRRYYTADEVETLVRIFGARRRYKDYRWETPNCTSDPGPVSSM